MVFFLCWVGPLLVPLMLVTYDWFLLFLSKLLILTFLLLYELVAESREWSDSDNTLLLQSVFTGKGQKVYSALPVTDSKVYLEVKTAVLWAYRWVPDAYHQRVSTWQIMAKKTYAVRLGASHALESLVCGAEGRYPLGSVQFGCPRAV